MAIEKPPVTGPADHGIDPTTIASAVSAVPGVIRLEPRLVDLASRLRRRLADLLADESTDPAQVGVEITRSGTETVATVVIDLATDAGRSARAVADEVRRTARRVMGEHGQPCRVVVNVLAIEDMAPSDEG